MLFDQPSEPGHCMFYVLFRDSAQLAVRALEDAVMTRLSLAVGNGEQVIGDPSRILLKVGGDACALRESLLVDGIQRRREFRQ